MRRFTNTQTERLSITNQRNRRRSDFIDFTRREKTPASQITNQKMTAKQVECWTSPLSDDFMSCMFTDDGITKEIDNIVFTNFNVSKPRITQYKEGNSGQVISKYEFPNGSVVCSIMGHNSIGLTMDCRDQVEEKIEKPQQIRPIQGGGYL